VIHFPDDLLRLRHPALRRDIPGGPGWPLRPTGAAKPQEVAISACSRDDRSMNVKRRIIDDALYAHFVTFSVYRRRRLLDHDAPRRILLGVLNAVLESFRAKCVGFVVMPDHVHAILWMTKVGHLSRFMHEWKRQSSIRIRAWYRSEAPHYFNEFGEESKFWQPKYYSFEIYERAKLEEKLTYMHLNPVRAGLAERMTDWKWSSALWYAERRSVGVPIEWVE
jgi:putative transposase